ncbi:MAG: RHS repeat-associated core domain-containing protein, partial [Planctomycetaceae bacterium]|nr:RHS repeat-associated core domain-containing protein [Planctomycetaceae bacterium]
KTITTYVIGHQRISQIVIKNGVKEEYYFTFDGHGSTRVLTDLAGVIVELYAFDAFGNALGFDPATAKTEFLYSGEQFDSKIGQQYLRQRYYNPTTGRFNRLDPFFGNLNDPLSLHKYLYTHADPVNGIDPSGEFTIGCLGISMNISTSMRTSHTSILNLAVSYNGSNLFTLTIPMYMARIAALLTGASVILPTIENFIWGMPGFMEAQERLIVKVAENIVKSTSEFSTYYPLFYGIYDGTTQENYDGTDTWSWGYSPKTIWYSFNQTIWLHKKSLELPPILLASLIVHESTHNKQNFITKGSYESEKEAYSKQSDFLKQNGISGDINTIITHMQNTYQQYNQRVFEDYITDITESMRLYGIQNPAIINNN